MSIRYGHSWPTGHGRRSWVSYRIPGWLTVFGAVGLIVLWPFVVLWLCWLLLKLYLMLALWLARMCVAAWRWAAPQIAARL